MSARAQDAFGASTSQLLTGLCGEDPIPVPRDTRSYTMAAWLYRPRQGRSLFLAPGPEESNELTSPLHPDCDQPS